MAATKKTWHGLYQRARLGKTTEFMIAAGKDFRHARMNKDGICISMEKFMTSLLRRNGARGVCTSLRDRKSDHLLWRTWRLHQLWRIGSKLAARDESMVSTIKREYLVIDYSASEIYLCFSLSETDFLRGCLPISTSPSLYSCTHHLN